MQLSIGLNTIMSSLNRVTKAGLLHPGLMRIAADEQIGKMEIVPAIADYPVKNLSGGNQQKVQLGRWLMGNTRLLILDEPTVGIDIGTKASIYRLLRDLASNGTPVIVVSSDIEEVLTIADRIIVMADGHITGTYVRGFVTQEQILAAASGEMN